MRRRERVIAALGAALVIAAAVSTTSVLAAHGAREVAPEARSDVVPTDLGFRALNACIPPWQGEGGFTISVDTRTGRVEFAALGGDVDDLAARDAYVESINTCLSQFTFEAQPFGPGHRIDAVAERLLAYDVAWRWVLPCLSGHGVPVVPPEFANYLAVDITPWSSLYDALPDDDFDALLDVRHGCGAGYLPREAP